MHKYLRAIGFHEVKTYSASSMIIRDVVTHSDRRISTNVDTGFNLLELSRNYISSETDSLEAGLEVIGELGVQNNSFLTEHIFPYVRKTDNVTEGDIVFYPTAENEAYIGVLDEPATDTSLMFYVQNILNVRRVLLDQRPYPYRTEITRVSLQALSTGGTILLPIQDEKNAAAEEEKRIQNMARLKYRASNGNEEAAMELAQERLDFRNKIVERLETEDVLSIVDTTLAPTGVDCETYMLLGNILHVYYAENRITKERLVIMDVSAKGYRIEVLVNQEDLTGEPAPGRRFRGTVWLQGAVLDENGELL